MSLWIRLGLFGALVATLLSVSSGSSFRRMSETCDLVGNSIADGIDRLQRLENRQHKLKNEGIDGRTKGRRRIARKIKKTRNKLEERLTFVLLGASKSLIKRTSMTFAEINDDESIMACWDADFDDFRQGHSGASRRKRNTDDGDDDEICSVTVDCSGESDTYRRIDGRCNNLDNPLWGAAATTQPRFMDPVYKDEVSEPRLAVNGDELPSPRELSNILFKHDVPTPDERFDNTLMSLNWGQFLDHDFVLTPVLSGEDGASITCCNDTGDPIDRDECMAITIPGDDEDMKNRTCMPFVRSSIAPNEDCNPGPKQVLNQLTSFIDASNVYGSSIDERDDLRFPSDNKTMDHWETSEQWDMLPNTSGNCVLNDACCKAGDARVNTQPGLAGLHLLFVMEHNRIVGKLREEDFPEEDLFEEARKIIGAFMQQITYGEYFSNVFNQATMQTYGLSLLNNGFANVYNASVDPGIRNAFATAAFRFGHSQIPDEIAYMLDDWNTLDDQTPMEDALLDPTMLITASGTRIPDLTRSMIGLKARRVDRFFEDSIRNTLFGSLDLPSLNIQRGRDHGLAPYIEWRRYCGLSVPTTFDELEDHNRQARNDLEGAYNNVTDIDLYAGAMLENRLTASYVGPTFACILGEQFRALKQGDRFWYENEGSTGFTVQQLRQIRRMRLSKILCNNFGIEEAQRNVFRMHDNNNNPRVNCADLPDMNFRPWNPQSG